MIDKERLEKGLYWQRAWKLVEGCAKVSPGCDNCWSEVETGMRARHPNEKISSRAKAVTMLDEDLFDGRITCREDNLDLPLRTKKPTVWAIWNDLWHEDVPGEFITRAFQVMERSRKLGHVFLVLTKRAERMGCFLSEVGLEAPDHIWWGVTAENQEQADARIPHLLRVPGKRFLSIEPMLSAIDLSAYFGGPYVAAPGDVVVENYNMGIDAVLLGGESGKNARPMLPDWVMEVRDQCAVAGIPYFHKQNGEWAPPEVVFSGPVAKGWCAVATWFAGQWLFSTENLSDDGGHPEDEPDVWRIGKKKAGRMFDGRTHDELPWLKGV